MAAAATSFKASKTEITEWLSSKNVTYFIHHVPKLVHTLLKMKK